MLPHQMKTLLRDYRDTWSASDSILQQKRDRRRAAMFYYLTPTGGAIVAMFWRVELTNTAPFLTALSVFTALLFGLLILVFNTAITLRKDGNSLKNAHDIARIIQDLRATITYSIAVAIILVIVLSLGTSAMITDPIPKGSPAHTPAPVPHLHWGWTPAFIWLAVHLLLNIAKILERVRTAFNYMSR